MLKAQFDTGIRSNESLIAATAARLQAEKELLQAKEEFQPSR
jgi:hypothetical protein